MDVGLLASICLAILGLAALRVAVSSYNDWFDRRRIGSDEDTEERNREMWRYVIVFRWIAVLMATPLFLRIVALAVFE